MPNPFDQFDDTPNGSITLAGPTPRLPSPQTPAQAQEDELSVRLKRLEIEEKERKAAAEAAKANQMATGLTEAKSQLKIVIEAAKRARELSKTGYFTTGFGANTAREWGGTGAKDVEGLLSTIGGNVAFERLQEMRQQSPTGGALGNVTEKELELLKSTIASLDQGQSDEQFQRNMDTIEERYQGVLDKIEGRQPSTRKGREAELEAAFSNPNLTPDERLKAANAIAEKYGRPLNQEDARTRAETGPRGRTNLVEDPSLLKQLGQSTLNVGASLIEGPGALIDAAAQAVGNVAAIPADWLGFEGVADQWRNPYGIVNTVESALPVPQDWGGWSARQAGRVVGGALALPARATNALSRAVLGRGPPPTPPTNALRSASRLSDDLASLEIDPTMAATGGPISRGLTTIASATPTGARPVVKGTRRMVDQGKRALERIGRREGGSETNLEQTGETARRGALAWRTGTRNQVSKVYDDATREAGDAKVMPQGGIQELERHIGELNAIPGADDAAATALPYLQSLKNELAEKFADGVTVAGVRGMRTVMRDRFVTQNLKGTDTERRIIGVIDKMSDDLATSLVEQGRGTAANLFRQADEAWKARSAMLDEVVLPIIGKKNEKSGEQIVDALQAASQGNARRFDRFLRSLPPEDAGDVRATLINAIGRAKPGGQNAAGDAFSFETFLTQWNRMQPRARRALFADRDAQAMESLARVSEQVRAAGKFANYSQSALGGVGAVTGYGLLSEPVAATLFLGGSYGLGRVLASPGAARAMLKISEAKTPATQLNAVRGLSEVAKRNPAIANEVLDLQARLSQAFQSPATAAAAQEQE